MTMLGLHGRVRLIEVPADTVHLIQNVNARIGVDCRVVVETSNCVTTVARQLVAALFAAGAGNPKVTDRVLTPATLPLLTAQCMEITDAVNPDTPTVDDFSLTGNTVWSAGLSDYLSNVYDGVMNVTYPDAGQITFGTLIPSTACSGKTITEEGLRNGYGDLLARTTFPGRLLSGSFGLMVEHTLTFTPV